MSLKINQVISESIMGISLRADTDRRIGMAVMQCSANYPGNGKASMNWNGKLHEGLALVGEVGVGAPGCDAYGLGFWQSRKGKPWQKDIEAHVENWRLPAKDYWTDTSSAFEVVDKLHEYPFHLECIPRSGGKWQASFDIHRSPLVKSRCVAICIAALKTIGVEIKDDMLDVSMV